VPANGLLTIFDRSWYGRVLVERVEKFAGDHEWQRAYQEINDFEDQLVQHGIIVVKFWLHIDQEEQLLRFKSREKTPHKQHKITDEDYRNREKWTEYREAIHDMISQTDSKAAPWTLISAQDKKFARIEVFKTLINSLKKEL
jgi:polyphosphate kinase 2 (PPK2 family)